MSGLSVTVEYSSIVLESLTSDGKVTFMPRNLSGCPRSLMPNLPDIGVKPLGPLQMHGSTSTLLCVNPMLLK
ncbi:unnamed protein product [Vitrella brassicaformis CCMP3155]|uniref:Uncharacterized protein n=1 Tax=Vitrella brassicaformis (strain CCMP3155) TaxID=1169540 RepID=A0A0G4GN31_VITBC|nr:unnamed protein product [Vitrella brassicaformis CCMP3155]|eukprot:CEM31607.1 unnamed protein product [Vitrella brassicaformis CCMP3155]